MNIKMQHKNVALDAQVRNLIERRARKARRMLPSYRSPDLDLHVNLEQKSSSRQFEATLVLTTPQTSIRVTDTEASAQASLTRAFDELLRKINKFKSQLNRERFWRRDVNRSEGVEVGADQRELEKSINVNLDRIENYIRRELFYLALTEPFSPESIRPQEVVDQVFYEVSSHLENRPAHLTLERWMFQLAHRCVRERAGEARETSSGNSSGIDSEEEIFNYYHPHEDVRFSELLLREGCSRKTIAEINDLDERIEAFIGHLSEPMREAFALNVLEGFDAKDVATITGQNPAEIKDLVSAARDKIRVQFCS